MWSRVASCSDTRSLHNPSAGPARLAPPPAPNHILIAACFLNEEKKNKCTSNVLQAQQTYQSSPKVFIKYWTTFRIKQPRRHEVIDADQLYSLQVWFERIKKMNCSKLPCWFKTWTYKLHILFSSFWFIPLWIWAHDYFMNPIVIHMKGEKFKDPLPLTLILWFLIVYV